MKAVYFYTIAGISLTFGIAACVPSVEAPAPTPAPVARPAPTPTLTPPPTPVVQEPRFENYLDAPQTPGNWEYARFPFGSQAIFNSGAAETSFAINCNTADRRISLNRPISTTAPRPMQIKTETSTRILSAQSAIGGMANLSVSLDPRDPILDAMAITKGRFAVQTEGLRTLYIPAWVELSRVIEDCR